MLRAHPKHHATCISLFLVLDRIGKARLYTGPTPELLNKFGV